MRAERLLAVAAPLCNRWARGALPEMRLPGHRASAAALAAHAR
jgi:hypothetical protein